MLCQFSEHNCCHFRHHYHDHPLPLLLCISSSWSANPNTAHVTILTVTVVGFFSLLVGVSLSPFLLREDRGGRWVRFPTLISHYLLAMQRDKGYSCWQEVGLMCDDQHWQLHLSLQQVSMTSPKRWLMCFVPHQHVVHVEPECQFHQELIVISSSRRRWGYGDPW